MSSPSSIPLVHTIASLRSLRNSITHPVALVPTMGLLHAGHLSLIRIAASHSTSIIVSIFANPTQLIAEDQTQDAYPSDLTSDTAILNHFNQTELANNADGIKKGTIAAIFAPSYEEMYPQRETPGFVTIPPLHERLEGYGRSSHFTGVATVCLKLFIAASPHVAVFGEKDYQQLILLKRLVVEFLLDIEIVSGAVVRDEKDGLALSSRNALLNAKQREVAPVLWRALNAGAAVYYDEKRCMRDEVLGRCAAVMRAVQQAQVNKGAEGAEFEILYLELVDAETLESVESVNPSKGAFLTGALQMLPLGKERGNKAPRLIDGLLLSPISKS